MKAINAFNAAINRAENFLRLYDLICDTRVRKVRSDWADNFRQLMHWPKAETFVRVDGNHRQSILLIRNAVGINRDQFAHEYLSDLLRASIVATVSALDRYVHDLVLGKCWKLLCRSEDKIPRELRRLSIPAWKVKRAVELLRTHPKARPGNAIKQSLQDVLHREFTFQRPNDIKLAADMLGIHDFWSRLAAAMPGSPTRGAVQDHLNEIADRRNQIVHEADLIRKVRMRGMTLRDIKRADGETLVDWLRAFVSAFEKIL